LNNSVIDVFPLGLYVRAGSIGQAGAQQQPPTTQMYSNQYAPPAHNYATGYAVNQEYMVNPPVPVQEVRCYL